MKTTTDLLTNSAFGFPKRGKRRRIEPFILRCIHITGNKPPVATAAQELNFANRPNSTVPSAHEYRDRNGDTLIALDPDAFAAWSNGDVKQPNTTLATVRRGLELRKQGHNFNEFVYRETENCGFPGSHPLTEAQLEVEAQGIAADSAKTGIPINRETVLIHSDINSVDRANDPFPRARREEMLAAVIRRAQAIAGGAAPKELGMQFDITGSAPPAGTVTVKEGGVSVVFLENPDRRKPIEKGKTKTALLKIRFIGRSETWHPAPNSLDAWLVREDGEAAFLLDRNVTVAPPE
jgi:hypothetical protein